jgi:beta-alanine degradation protein BauB
MRCTLLFLLLSGTACWAQDVVLLSPDYKVEIDNPWVRVLRVRHPAHAKIPLHEHPNAVGVALTDVHERIVGTDGRPRIVDRKAGEIGFSPAGQHTEENISDQPLEAVIIELKSGAPKSPPASIDAVQLDPVKLDPTHHLVVVENDRVRVLRTTLDPHVKSPMHRHPHYVVVYLTEMHTTMKLGDGRVVDNPRHSGEIAWRDALEHQTEQMGDQAAVEIQFEIK